MFDQKMIDNFQLPFIILQVILFVQIVHPLKCDYIDCGLRHFAHKWIFLIYYFCYKYYK